MKIENVDKNLKTKLCKIVSETVYNVFRVELSSKEVWEFTVILFRELKETTSTLINDLLFVARQDFEASKALYEKKLYSQSVYHLQQCVEKITKAFGLWSGFIEEKELYPRKKKENFLIKILRKAGFYKKEEYIGHISPKVFVLLLRKKFIKKYTSLLSSQIKNNGIKQLIKNYNNELKNLEKSINKTQKLATLSNEDISKFLEVSNTYLNILEKIDKRKLNSLLLRFRMGITSRLEGESLFNILDMINKGFIKIENKMEHIFRGCSALIFLYPLSIITYPHFTYTRYPTNKLKPQDYNENLGIITLLPEIIMHVGKVIENLENLIKTE